MKKITVTIKQVPFDVYYTVEGVNPVISEIRVEDSKHDVQDFFNDNELESIYESIAAEMAGH